MKDLGLTKEEIQELNDSIIWWQNRTNALSKTNEEHRKINGKLREENKQLKEKIDKAIDYIEIQQKIFRNYDIVSENQLKNILEILKGDSNE